MALCGLGSNGHYAVGLHARTAFCGCLGALLLLLLAAQPSSAIEDIPPVFMVYEGCSMSSSTYHVAFAMMEAHGHPVMKSGMEQLKYDTSKLRASRRMEGCCGSSTGGKASLEIMAPTTSGHGKSAYPRDGDEGTWRTGAVQRDGAKSNPPLGVGGWVGVGGGGGRRGQKGHCQVACISLAWQDYQVPPRRTAVRTLVPTRKVLNCCAVLQD